MQDEICIRPRIGQPKQARTPAQTITATTIGFKGCKGLLAITDDEQQLAAYSCLSLPSSKPTSVQRENYYMAL